MNTALETAQRPDQKVLGWLLELDLWKDGVFTIHALSPATANGSYTDACYLVEKDGKRFFVKTYHPLATSGQWAEYDAYSRFGNHPIFPRPVTALPRNLPPIDYPSAILLPFYEPLPESLSVIEVLAACFNLSTIFYHFTQEGFIYFDLKLDSLRIDSEGCLRLIDFTDLITTTELYSRDSGLPVVDRTSPSIPPEGLRYQEVYDAYAKTYEAEGPVEFESVVSAAQSIDPEKYQVFALSSLALELLGGRTPEAVAPRIKDSASKSKGGFTEGERAEIVKLLSNAQVPSPFERPGLTEVTQVLWQLLKPRVTSKQAGRAASARQLLSTFSARENDPLFQQIFDELGILPENVNHHELLH